MSSGFDKIKIGKKRAPELPELLEGKNGRYANLAQWQEIYSNLIGALGDARFLLAEESSLQLESWRRIQEMIKESLMSRKRFLTAYIAVRVELDELLKGNSKGVKEEDNLPTVHDVDDIIEDNIS